ncbi:unnamed protein product [Rhizophagus irregularis]|nr:unnamed protein product [Rhizophagus irregularis]CAB4445732.1 unnamed protein product [Rhizophagus irregularis]CAB5356352.1 unnamed protein product [Rhizophagus irregularis]
MSLQLSEYWVSQQKHWCQYCRIYIADNKPSRTMHEQGKKHKENVEKFLRNIRRKDHENRKEEEKTRRELERIERAAMKQYKKDIILEVPGASIASLKSTSNTNAPPVISSFSEHDVIYAGSTTNYTELAELSKSGKSADGTEAVIGEWRPVTPPPAPPPAPPVNNALETDQGNNTSTSQEAILQDDEEDEDPDDLRNFKVVEKTFPLDDQIPEDILKDNDSGKVTFKKRKLASQSNTRNIRKKKC